ncbi:MAG: tetraacyldisaccharide 4'-kinase [Syntrophobacteraceae bacterium]
MKIISDFSATLNKAINRRMLSAWYPIDVSLSGDTSRSGFSKGPPAILRAASSLYEKALRKDQTRRLRKRVKLAAPVISIGNISVGGTGKSPLTIWICEFLLKIGCHPAVLSRGYARRGGSPGPVPSLDNPAELSGLFGDEPVMISEYLPSVPVWVGGNRAASGMAALARGGVDVLVLDDGFQHLGLYRDLDIVLLDCRSAFGNGFVLPAGPLREPPSNLKRADALVITHAGKDGDAALLGDKIRGLFPGIPVFACRHTLRGIGLTKGEPLFPLSSLLDRKAVIFSGIARPEGFFSDLGKAGLRICDSLSFPNHHRYAMGDFSKIFGSASRHGAKVIITTAKDAIRIPLPFRNAIAVAEMGIDFGPDHEGFCSLTRGRLGMTVG